MASLVEEGIGLEQERVMVLLAQEGDPKALEDLIRLSQPWLFNLVLRMVPDFHEAEDLCQEILLKSILKLPGFRSESRYRTWLYRLAVNHILNMKESRCERDFASWKSWSNDKLVERYLDQEPADTKAIPFDLILLAKEVRIKCMMGMLLCLNRKHRAVFILGSILGVAGRTGSEILGMSETNYRKALSRARGRLLNFMRDRCSLVNPGKPCSCERCVPLSIRNGDIDPLRLLFGGRDAPAVRDLVSQTRERLDNIELRHCQDLYRDHSFLQPPDFSRKVLDLLASAEIQGFLDAEPTG